MLSHGGRLRDNPGLKLANAFGVFIQFQTEAPLIKNLLLAQSFCYSFSSTARVTQTGLPSGKKMNPSPYPVPFTSAHTRAGIVKILLIVGAVVTFMSLITESLSLVFPPLTDDQEFADNPMGAVVVLVTFLFALVDLVVYLTTVVFFLMWLYRAYANLRAFRAGGRLDYSPGFAVGSFFIPFVNLVVPYRGVREVWQKSGPPDEALFAEPSPPASFPVWWLFWILASFAGNISMRLSFNESVPPNTATMVSIIASVLFIIAAVFAYLVVTEIDKRQEETSEKLKLGRFAVPLPPPAHLSMPDVMAPVTGPNNFQQS